MNKLAVVIVNYNVRHYLRQCLDSVQRAAQGMDVEIWVADNHSTDGSVDYLKPLFPAVQWIECHHNLGFSRANNLILRQLDCDYILLLNPDTIVGENTLKHVVAFLDTHPDAGAVGVKMLNSNGTKALESRRGVPTPMTALYKMLGLCKLFPKHPKFGHYYMSDMSWEENAPIEIVSGACFFTKKSILDEVGLLDQAFFMYGEDIDFAYRILKAGYTNWYIPATILHYKGESTQKSSFRYVHVFYKAMLIFLRKHFRHLRIWITVPIKIAIWAKALLTLVRNKMRDVRKTLGLIADRQTFDIEYILVSNASRRELVKQIHRTTGIILSFVEKTPEDDEADKAYTPDDILDMLNKNADSTCVVYDIEYFSFEEIFNMIENHNKAHIDIGTFDNKSMTIITRSETITCG